MRSTESLQDRRMDWNAARYDPLAPRDHVESHFLKANAPGGERALWLKATILSRASEPGATVAEGWAVAFDRRGGARKLTALKRTVPIHRATFDRAALGVRWDEPESGTAMALTEGAVRGHLDDAGQRIAWDLRYEPHGAPMELLPYAWMYDAAFPKSKLVTPAPDATFSGEVHVGGERWSLDGWRGMQGHNWGRGHADLYAWSHVSLWDKAADEAADGAGDEDPVVLEVVSARVRTGPVLLPVLTLAAVRVRGIDYRFNRPADMARAKAHIDGLHYRVSVASDLGKLEAELTADPADTAGLYYANPAGPMTHCLNSKLARARLSFEPAGRPRIERTSTCAALEIGTHTADPAVRMLA